MPDPHDLVTLLAAAVASPDGEGGSWLLVAGLGMGLAALVLFLLELFLPTGGLLGLLCALCVLGSIAAFFRQGFSWGIAAVSIYCVLAPMALVFGLKAWSHSPIARRLILGAAEDVDPDDAEAVDRLELARRERLAALRKLVGVEGTAATPLRPVGFVVIEGRRIDALAEGDLIDSGTPVVVIDVVDNQLKVRPR